MPLPVGEVTKLINLYRARPDLFSDDQIEALDQQAESLKINFKPLQQQADVRKLAKQFTYGFGEGRSWKPSAAKWISYSAYFDIAHLAESKQNYLVSNARYGQAYKITTIGTPMVITPYFTTGAADNNGTTWVDIGAGVSLTNWFVETSYTPYKITSQLFLEARQKVFGNSDDTHTIRMGYVFLY